jgi:hypothetical protein
MQKKPLNQQTVRTSKLSLLTPTKLVAIINIHSDFFLGLA